MKRIVKRRYLGVLVLLVVAGIALGLTVSGGRSSNPPAGLDKHGARKRDQVAVSRPPAAAIYYQPEGVSLTGPPAGFRPPLSRTAVLALFRRWPAGPHLKGKPTVKLWTVRDGHPAHGGYPAWVVTFHHTRPTSYGIASVPQKPECDFVSIYDLRTRVWTEDFQNCTNQPATHPSKTRAGGAGSFCDSGCTPANQPALDAAANFAETVAGNAHRFTGVEVDDPANKVIVYLTHAPQSVINELNARHPGIYVIHNDAPRTLRVLTGLEKAFNFSVLKPEDIQVVSVGPTVTGYLQVGVTSQVAVAQAKLNRIYGPNIIRVNKQSMAIGWGYSGRGPTPKTSVIRSTQASPANAAETRQWTKKPLAVADGNDPSVLHLVLRGDGCKPIGTSALLRGKMLMLFLHPAGRTCFSQSRLYEVTLSFAKPIVDYARIRKVVADYGKLGRQKMKLAVVIAG